MASVVATWRLSTSTRVWGALAVVRGLDAKRYVSTTAPKKGLDEFFPQSDDLLEEADKIGRSWRARELRQKSTEDLHKLWYVLLKERNKLLTMKHEAHRLGFIMPGPTRLGKVKRGMAGIKLVLSERDRAIKEAVKLIRAQQAEKTDANGQVQPSTDASTDSEQDKHTAQTRS